MQGVVSIAVVSSSLLFGCTPALFPSGTLKDVDRNFDFTRWWMSPISMENHKVQLGGRIVQSSMKGPTVTIVTAQLPIVEHPAYGPKETRKLSREFVILYQGKIDPVFLHPGNRLIVVGRIVPPIRVEVHDVLRILPTVTAQCVHIWQTGDKDIEDFASSGAGYIVLREETYCGDETPWAPMSLY